MIESIEFKNFKALRNTILPLAPCTIIVGPNGSGKSTALQALEVVRKPGGLNFPQFASFSVRNTERARILVKLNWSGGPPRVGFERHCTQGGGSGGGIVPPGVDEQKRTVIQQAVNRIRLFSLKAEKIAGVAQVQDNIELASDGGGIAAVLDGMRDEAPENFKAIESQLGQWLPEFDCILFDRPQQGAKSIALRTREGQYKVPAGDLSQGTLIALALLTLAYHPTPPSLVALEEPDNGIHPYLLRRIRDALYRLSHPDSCGENREPVQVIATTHNPYFVNLFAESPEEIVVANKVGLDVKFERLTDQPHFQDILGEAALGEAWFSGVLGGVPIGS